jgi:hypothetical protein
MKKLLSLFIVFYCIVATVSPSSAANLNDHELYKIVTYTFNKDYNPDETGIAKKTNSFEPLMITRTKADIISGRPNQEEQIPFTTGKKIFQSFAVVADYQATPNLGFRGVIGVTKNASDTSAKLNFDSSWEANIGVIYKLFNNFSYEMHFGFMDAGDLFKNSNAYHDVESIVMINNQLTMSF